MAVACLEEVGIDNVPDVGKEEENVISPSVRHVWTMEMPVTRSLVDNLTTQEMEANFLRIDEDVNEAHNGLYTYDAGSSEYEGKINWEKAKIIEASVISSPDNTGRRSVYLNPVQAYPVYVKTVDDVKITTYYHTRLISWYPRTCELIKDSETGMATDYIFSVYNNSMSESGGSRYEAEGGQVKIRFTGLNGEKDVMVSDVVEAQQWHDDSETDVICGSSDAAYTGMHRVPLGHNDAQDQQYESLMTYKHYMSAVRVNAYPKDMSEQIIGLWGKIRKVVVVNQPTECLVSLPSSVDAATGRSGYGDVEFGDDLGNFDLVRTSMFGDDANNEYHYVADEVSTLENYSQSDPMKLGYALIASGKNLLLDVHTDAGVYRVEVPATQEITDGNGNTTTLSLFEAGKIYDVQLEFQTTNTIAALILSDDGYKYYDLTAGKMYAADYGDYYDYKYSNCYVIHPNISDERVDGFCFNATVIGNGDDGILSGFDRTTANITPLSAGLIWESEYGLIQQVELLFGYVRFRVPDYKVTSGNAVIGVFDGDGNVLWSWHIWIVDTIISTVTYTVGSEEVEIMDRNLGSLYSGVPDSDENALKSYGLYYQWGRKDPSMGPPSFNYMPMSTATSEYFDGFGDSQLSAGVVNIPQPRIEDGIDNPMYLILPTEWPAEYQYDWLYDQVNHLWGGGTNNIKTIYDPCPEGYVVPGDEINLILSNAIIDAYSSKYGLTAYDESSVAVYFPYSGYKGVDRGMSSLNCSWKYVGQKGDYMSAKILSSGHRSRAYVSSSTYWEEVGADGTSANYSGQNYYIDGANRRTAGSVRCIKDDDGLGSITVDMSIDKDYYFDGEILSGSFEYYAQGFVLGDFTLEYAYGQDSEGELTWTGLAYNASSGAFQCEIDCQENTHIFFRLSADITSLGEGVKFTKIFSSDVYAYYNSDFNYEGDNLLTDKYYTISSVKDSGLMLGMSDDGVSAEVASNDASSELGMYDHILRLEDVQISSEMKNYRNVATCKIKHYMSGKYLVRKSGGAGGVQFTDNIDEATVFYLCSDWYTDSVTQTTIDILDKNENYLYVTDGKDVRFNTSFAGKSYKWYINRVKDPVGE